MKNPSILFIIIIFFISIKSWSYPHFIGIGYTSCMTCHYNPQGNGQLNDYGRALFATEIAAKPFWNLEASNEKLGDQSSFTYRKPEPAHFKPAFKYRELYLNSGPGGSGETKRYVMESDLGFAFHFDKADKYIFVASAGYTRTPINTDITRDSWNYNLLSREHYLRVQLSDSSFISVGLMDIVYGLRIADHKAANREGIGLGMNDQVHGVLYSFFKDKWSLGVHGFAGNLMRDEISRISGLSTLLEYELVEKLTIGGSVLSGSTTSYSQSLLGFHSRLGIGQGSSIMAEVGVNHKELKVTPFTTLNGFYGILTNTIHLMRGLDFETSVELLKVSMDDITPENFRYVFGLTYFPAQRFEFKIDFINSRTLSPNEVKADSWQFINQVHISI